MSNTSNQNNDWWTYHGNPQRTGCVQGSNISSETIENLTWFKSLQVQGPILSIPAIANGYVFVGTANRVNTSGGQESNGGHLHKIALSTGTIENTFSWEVDNDEGDTHGFMGMGCTPTVVNGLVYFSAFNGYLYCLNESDLSLKWQVNLRNRDLAFNQPVENDNGQAPKAEGWCSPLVVNGKVYVGIGEGENPALYGFIFCLAADTGMVQWIFCTNQFEADKDNAVNQLPAAVLPSGGYSGFTSFNGEPTTRGCSVWTAISYDDGLNRIYATTGNPAPNDFGLDHTYPDQKNRGNNLPPPKYCYGILSLDASTGDYKGFYGMPPESSYRHSDIDVDFGASPLIFTLADGTRAVGAGCKNGSFVIVNADTMALINQRQMLPYYQDGSQIPTVDTHGPDTGSDPNPIVSNEASNITMAENFYGTYSTGAVDSDSACTEVFMGVGGNNYHMVAPGIDFETTPFLRAMKATGLSDSWALEPYTIKDVVTGEDKIVERYPLNKVTKSINNETVGMYTTAGESGISSPAVVNDLVFCSTSKVAVYAFKRSDGTLVWADRIGDQTNGMNGGYGYCLGPAIAGDYVVVGGLIYGSDGGLLKIYKLNTSSNTTSGGAQ